MNGYLLLHLQVSDTALIHALLPYGLPCVQVASYQPTTMALVDESTQTTTRTTLGNPSWGKPAAVEWPVPEEYNRSFPDKGKYQSLLPSYKNRPGRQIKA